MRRTPTFPIVLAGFTAFLDLYAIQPLLPMLARLFHASAFDVSLTVTAPTIAVALASPFAGRLGEVCGRRHVIVGSAFAMAATAILTATAQTLSQLIVWRFLQGLVTPGVFAVTIAYVHEQWDGSRTGGIVGAYVSGTIVGGFSGRLITGIVAGGASWQAAFAALGLCNLAAAAALWLWLPPERPSRTREAAGRLPISLVRDLASRELLATYAVGFCVLFTLVAMFTYVTFLLAAPPFHLTTAALGSLFIVYLVGAAVTAVVGRRVDVHGHRAVIAAAAVVGVVGALLTLSHALTAIVAGLAVCCSGLFVAQATATSYVGGAAGRSRGVAIGLYATIFYAGGSAGGALPALFWNAGGWPACVALVIAVLLAMGAIGVLCWRDHGGPIDLTEAAAQAGV